MASNNTSPGRKGFVEGFKSFAREKLSFPTIQKPDQEVRDATRIVMDQGPKALHRKVSSAPLFQEEPYKSQSKYGHKYSGGFAAGAVVGSTLMNLAILAGSSRIPALRPHAKKIVGANLMHSGAILFDLPNQLNRRIKNTAPEMHQAVSKQLHTEAEAVRNKKG